MEHRWGQRVRVDWPVRIKGKTFNRLRARLSDLSLSGAFIQVDMDVRILCRLQVALNVSHLTPNAVSLHAHVVRKGYRGVGIEWAALAPATYRSLLRMASRWRSGQQTDNDPRPLWRLATQDQEMAITTPGIADGLCSTRRATHASSDSVIPVLIDQPASL
jgi:PilZ domain